MMCEYNKDWKSDFWLNNLDMNINTCFNILFV
jgi:hypothetical protein